MNPSIGTRESERTKAQIAVMQAHLEGAHIQFRELDNPDNPEFLEWTECMEPLWDWSQCDYRVAPLPAEPGPRAGDDKKLRELYVGKLAWAESDPIGYSAFRAYTKDVAEQAICGGVKHCVRFVEQPESWAPPRPAGDEAALAILHKWHNWIATGQLAFTNEHLAESKGILEAAGLPVVHYLASNNQQLASAAREWDVSALQRYEMRLADGHYGTEAGPYDLGEWVRFDDVEKLFGRASAPPPARTVPEGVPPLEGEFADFDYFGVGPLKVLAEGKEREDVAAFFTDLGSDKWSATNFDGGDDSPESNYAIRRGTELHRRNFTP